MMHFDMHCAATLTERPFEICLVFLKGSLHSSAVVYTCVTYQRKNANVVQGKLVNFTYNYMYISS